MISAGTGICGGSAIAAMAPVIEAEDKDITYAMSATFLFKTNSQKNTKKSTLYYNESEKFLNFVDS